jgi:rubrerythrin
MEAIMVTRVGKQTNFNDAVSELIELEYDAVDAYEAAISRLENAAYKKQLTNFKDDHQRHIRALTDVMNNHGEKAPTGPGIGKQLIAKGKVIIANLMGDKAILMAMQSNEEDTNTAYERMSERRDQWDDIKLIINKGREDEGRHKDWLDKTLES